MNLPTLSIRNARRNLLRTFLTVLGVTLAVVAFGFLRTVIGAWYAGVEASAADRLIARSKVSLVVPLPIAYKAKIQGIPGVTEVAAGNWFGGIYRDDQNFSFPNFAVEMEPFLKLYPEFLVSEEEKKALIADRSGCAVGAKTAKQYGIELGDKLTLRGSIFPGNWDFTVRAIYRGRERTTDATILFFHRKLIDETLEAARGRVGFYYIGIDDPKKSAQIARAVDAEFKDTMYPTLTESEKAFQLSFISMVGAIITALQIVSGFVLVIVALILGNTIAMSVRDRAAEVAILKVLGYRGGRLALLIAGEATFVGALGGIVGIGVAIPLINGFGKFVENNLGQWFPVFFLEHSTMVMMIGLSAGIGFVAALIPALRVARLPVSEAIRELA